MVAHFYLDEKLHENGDSESEKHHLGTGNKKKEKSHMKTLKCAFKEKPARTQKTISVRISAEELIIWILVQKCADAISVKMAIFDSNFSGEKLIKLNKVFTQ